MLVCLLCEVMTVDSLGDGFCMVEYFVSKNCFVFSVDEELEKKSKKRIYCETPKFDFAFSFVVQGVKSHALFENKLPFKNSF